MKVIIVTKCNCPNCSTKFESEKIVFEGTYDECQEYWQSKSKNGTIDDTHFYKTVSDSHKVKKLPFRSKMIEEFAEEK